MEGPEETEVRLRAAGPRELKAFCERDRIICRAVRDQ
jgi:hypothetical protein